MRLLPTALLLSPALLLAACGNEPEVVTGDDSREASGEILEGSISDAMLPLDKVRSQAPLRESPAPAGSSTPAQSPTPELAVEATPNPVEVQDPAETAE